MRNRHLSVLLFLVFVVLMHESRAQETCQTNDDCQALYICSEGACKHKEIFPLTVREIIFISLIMLVAGPAHGLGAGSVMTPLLYMGLNYDASSATVIMQALILGGSFGAFLNAFWRKNPKTGKPVIDYDVSMVIMPLVLIGVNIGVLIKFALPQIVLIFGLLALEVRTANGIWVKAREQHSKENISSPLESLLAPKPDPQLDQYQAQAIEGLGNIELKDLRKAHEEQEKREQKEANAIQTNPEENKELQTILAQDQALFPCGKLFRIFIYLAWIIVLAVLRSRPLLNVTYCGPRFWILFGISLYGCYGFHIWNKRYVKTRCDIKKAHGFSSESDFLLKPNVLNQIGRVAIFAGLFAGFFGIGAGVIMGPSLLAYGLPPGVFGPTMAYGIVQSALIAIALTLLLSSAVNIIELLFFFGLAVFGSYFVNRAISFIVNYYKKPSISLWITIGIVFSSILIMPLYTIYKSIEDPAAMFKYRWIC